ncbi:MAG: hypothetical protein LBB63_00980 [Holosporaceae bacterium]|nr:hypothetical protein [Holosporaceae bacterium]
MKKKYDPEGGAIDNATDANINALVGAKVADYLAANPDLRAEATITGVQDGALTSTNNISYVFGGYAVNVNQNSPVTGHDLIIAGNTELLANSQLSGGQSVGMKTTEGNDSVTGQATTITSSDNTLAVNSGVTLTPRGALTLCGSNFERTVKEAANSSATAECIGNVKEGCLLVNGDINAHGNVQMFGSRLSARTTSHGNGLTIALVKGDVSNSRLVFSGQYDGNSNNLDMSAAVSEATATTNNFANNSKKTVRISGDGTGNKTLIGGVIENIGTLTIDGCVSKIALSGNAGNSSLTGGFPWPNTHRWSCGNSLIFTGCTVGFGQPIETLKAHGAYVSAMADGYGANSGNFFNGQLLLENTLTVGDNSTFRCGGGEFYAASSETVCKLQKQNAAVGVVAANSSDISSDGTPGGGEIHHNSLEVSAGCTIYFTTMLDSRLSLAGGNSYAKAESTYNGGNGSAQAQSSLSVNNNSLTFSGACVCDVGGTSCELHMAGSFTEAVANVCFGTGSRDVTAGKAFDNKADISGEISGADTLTVMGGGAKGASTSGTGDITFGLGNVYNNHATLSGTIEASAVNGYGGCAMATHTVGTPNVTGLRIANNELTTAGAPMLRVGSDSKMTYVGNVYNDTDIKDNLPNTLTVTGVIRANVVNLYGGYANTATANANMKTHVSNNKLTIEKKGVIEATTINLYGGVMVDVGAYVANAARFADNNIVTIRGTLAGDEISLYGGVYHDYANGGAKTAVQGATLGNELIVENAVVNNIADIKGFQKYTFRLTPDQLEAEAPILAMKDNAAPLQIAPETKVTIEYSEDSISGSYELVERKVTLINKMDQVDIAPANVTFTPSEVDGHKFEYEIANVEGKNYAAFVATLWMRAPPDNSTEQWKNSVETEANSMNSLCEVADVAETCMNNFSQQAPTLGNVAPFAQSGAGASRVHSGSYVDNRGFFAVVGLGVTGQNTNDVAGLFCEFGSGSYDSHNDLAGGGEIRGSGKTGFTGGGVMWRYNIDTSDNSRLYFDAIWRTGTSKMDYNSSDIVDAAAPGVPTAYAIRARYHGFSCAVGHVHDVNDDLDFNCYVRYAYVRQGGQNTRLSTGRRLEVDPSNSQRLIFGMIMSHKIDEIFRTYCGAEYEREYNGRIDAKLDGRRLDSPSLRGRTAKGELGLSYSEGGFTVKAGLEKSFGVCRGLQAKLQLTFNF